MIKRCSERCSVSHATRRCRTFYSSRSAWLGSVVALDFEQRWKSKIIKFQMNSTNFLAPIQLEYAIEWLVFNEYNWVTMRWSKWTHDALRIFRRSDSLIQNWMRLNWFVQLKVRLTLSAVRVEFGNKWRSLPLDEWCETRRAWPSDPRLWWSRCYNRLISENEKERALISLRGVWFGIAQM